MPTTRNASNGSTITTTSNQQQTIFKFPENTHLVIATPRHVFAWDSAGIHTIFQSSRGGIVAAREAKDGSGVLAVASSNVVVMHDTKRGNEESWGLNAPQDEVRHLEYTPDAKSLFLSTTTDGTIQHYSTERSRLIDPAHKHEAAPVALAISPTGHMMLSASQNPPVVYLKNLTHNTAPLHVQPSASNAAVSCAAFHPERQNVFLLAFRDGSVAAYDATRMAKKGIYSNQASVNDGEIARIAGVHRAIASGDDSFDIAPPIAGAAFLPGFKTRAVTAGRDGKCKIIDFANGGVTIRTWHAKAPITSVSVLALKAARGPRRTDSGSGRSGKPATHTIGGPTSTDCLIAVSRVDGKVHAYNSVGLLLAEKNISGMEEKVLSIEWAKGPSPSSTCEDSQRHLSDDDLVAFNPTSSQRALLEQDQDETAVEPSTICAASSQHLGLPTSLRKATLSRQLTVHPDEETFSTVRYTPSPNRTQQPALTGIGYQDLFSPVKQDAPKVTSPPQPRITSPPPRNRPRLSSQTFVKSTESPKSAIKNASSSAKYSLFPSTESHATSSSSASIQAESSARPTLKPPRKATTAISPLSKSKRHITFAKTGDGSISSRSTPAATVNNNNARVLADLRKLSKGDSSQRNHGMLSSYAASQRSQTQARTVMADPRSTISQSNDELSRAVTDSSLSWSFEDDSEDIWLTSDSDEDQRTRQRRRRYPERPPGRQTSRSRVDSKGTVSTSVLPPSSTQLSSARIDGSTDDDAFATARSQLSPAAPFSPQSEQVRELFPRSSSLSPAKNRGARKTSRRSPVGKENSLTRMAINAAFGQQSKSPWARVKSGKSARLLQVYEDADGAVMSGALPRSEGFTCLTCPETKARVQGLESEVAQLKGEVLAMKAILRRNGLPFPACLKNR
ncbi:hypothetical protein PRZ48_002401 [Zasmidium cellare]|uniref:WD40 repeat-like protein n=1 Tax=Zasmidium cellare TaxID=395010 RepID=A0ABR0F3X0_ZASCE|nr:hypothetical protein PRZ48_002401 [Zasmidium cellare]